MKEATKFWDETLKLKMEEVCKHPAVDDGTKHYVSEAAWYVEHDLADGRFLNCVMRMMNVASVLKRETFYRDVYPEKEDSEEVGLLREVGKLTEQFLGMM